MPEVRVESVRGGGTVHLVDMRALTHPLTAPIRTTRIWAEASGCQCGESGPSVVYRIIAAMVRRLSSLEHNTPCQHLNIASTPCSVNSSKK